MANNYQMDSLDTEGIIMTEKGRPESIYDSSGVSDPNVAKYINFLQQSAENRDRKATAEARVKASDAYWNISSDIRQYDAEQKNAKAKADELASMINPNTIPKEDFVKALNARYNEADNKGKDSLDRQIERAATIRHVVANLDDRETAAWLGMLTPRMQDKMLDEQRKIKPDAFPSPEQLQGYTNDIKQALMDGEPKPDLNDMQAIKSYVLKNTDSVYNEHRNAESEAIKAMQSSKSTMRYTNPGLSDIPQGPSGSDGFSR